MVCVFHTTDIYVATQNVFFVRFSSTPYTYVYDDSYFRGDRGLVRRFFVSAILGTGIFRSNSFVQAPSSGGGSNAPRSVFFVPHLDVNADGGWAGQARCAQKIYFERYSPVTLRILTYGDVDKMKLGKALFSN